MLYCLSNRGFNAVAAFILQKVADLETNMPCQNTHSIYSKLLLKSGPAGLIHLFGLFKTANYIPA